MSDHRPIALGSRAGDLPLDEGAEYFAISGSNQKTAAPIMRLLGYSQTSAYTITMSTGLSTADIATLVRQLV